MTFVDTSFWYALAAPDDARHEQAVGLLGRYGRDAVLTTSERVIEETWTLLRRRKGHDVAVHVVDSLCRSARIRHMPIDKETALEAWEWLRRHDERAYLFVDASSFMLMRRLGLDEVLAFDGDFSAAGFVELR